MPRQHIHFVTGRLAEASLRAMVVQLAPKVGFDFTVEVLPITVAALMTAEWIAKHWHIPASATEVMITGYCDGDLATLELLAGKPVIRGPRDLRQLPQFFGRPTEQTNYGAYDIEIIAEINHAPRLALAEILAQAESMRAAGADVIDVGCQPGETWSGVGETVRALHDAGHRVSIDSLNIAEIAAAARAGAELVLSVDRTNRYAAADWGIEVVAIPDAPGTLDGLDETIAHLTAANVAFRIDPILEPIGYGFAASLKRCFDVREKMPDVPLMLGIGNLTELTDVDSAGVNVVLLAICQELRIHSVLTTQVINWARTSVRECDLARRLVYHAITERTLPKHVEPRLVALRDPQLLSSDAGALERLAAAIKDNNYRIFAEDELLHLVSAQLHLTDVDPFVLFDKLRALEPKNLDASHAFYLGYELSKAATARTLSKNYRQDESLDWGYLTVPETSHRLTTKSAARVAAAATPEPKPATSNEPAEEV